MADLGKPPDGYEWIDGGPRMVLIDPEVCPAGHPAEITRRGWDFCPVHQHHNNWTCACGQEIWRIPGEFVGELNCR